MKRYVHFVNSMIILLRGGLYTQFFRQIWEKIIDTSMIVFLERECSSFEDHHILHESLFLRPVSRNDRALLHAMVADRSLPTKERREAARRLTILDTGVGSCHVIEDRLGHVLFMQWSFAPEDDYLLRYTFGEWYPTLAEGETLIEYAYVFPMYRGTGTLPCAVARVLEALHDTGTQRILTMIPTHNLNSLRSFMRMGFIPFEVRVDKKILGIFRRTTYSLHDDCQLRALKRILPEKIVDTLTQRQAKPSRVDNTQPVVFYN